MKLSVCIPTYKSATTIRDTIQDVLNQTYQNFEIIVSDDNSGDNIKEIIESFKDNRIKFYQNTGKRLDCGGNQRKCLSLATGDIMFLLPGKARISKRALELCHQAFLIDADVGAVTRPYYWFGEDINHAVRAKRQSGFKLVDVNSPPQDIIAVLDTVDNSGAIAYRREWITHDFVDTPFVEFTYPFVSILKKHKVVLLKDYIMACPAFLHSHSQDAYVYETSPLQNWIDLYDTFFKDMPRLHKALVDNAAKNYVGLVQIRNWAPRYSCLLRELRLLLWFRPWNIFNQKFWFFTIVCLSTPRFILKRLVKWFKGGRRLDVSLI